MSAHERERLAGYLDGELTPAERSEVEAHLAACEECASLLAGMGAVDEITRGLPLEAPSGFFEAFPGRVRARIEAESPPRARTAPSRERWRLPLWTWAVAAALLLAVVTPLTLPRLHRARVGTREAPLAATPMEQAITQAPQSAPERLATAPAGDRPPAGPPPKPVFAPPPPAAAAPMARARPDKMAAAEAPLRPAESRVRGLDEDAPARAGGAPSVAVEGESFEEAPPPGPDVDHRPVAMADATATRATPATLGKAAGGASAPQAAETRGEGFAAVETQSVPGEDSVAFGRLARDVPTDAPAWRERREAWRTFVATHPRSRHVDEARVRIIEAGLEAWRAGGDPEDLARARADAEAYLARDDAPLKERVRRALESAESR